MIFFEKPDDSIWEYYGLDRDSVDIHSWEFDEGEHIGNSFIEQISSICYNRNLYLLITVNANSFINRHLLLSDQMRKKYGISSVNVWQTLYTQESSTFLSGIVSIEWHEICAAISLLYSNPYCVVLATSDEQIGRRLAEKIVAASANNGSLNFPAILHNFVSVLHIIRGNDGYSINLLSMNHPRV